LLAGIGREAPLRPCAYRAVGGCTLWALQVSELQPLLRTFPELHGRLTAAVHDRCAAYIGQQDAVVKLLLRCTTVDGVCGAATELRGVDSRLLA